MQADAATGRVGSQIKPRLALAGFVSELQAIQFLFEKEVSKCLWLRLRRLVTTRWTDLRPDVCRRRQLVPTSL